MPSLPEPAPSNPLPLVEQWLLDPKDGARKNPWAMALATVASDGRPSVRYVLLKHFSAGGGFLVFHTNYSSRKAAELEACPRAAAVLYWADLGRQLRFEGRVERSPAAESDAYFASRPRLSQLNAWASRQSERIESTAAMRSRVENHEIEFQGQASIPRPVHWGGYRLMIEALELWVEGNDRFHERLRYERGPTGAWSHAYLQP
jgi:pyridoxamine 5'-phosphate oxidase